MCKLTGWGMTSEEDERIKKLPKLPHEVMIPIERNQSCPIEGKLVKEEGFYDDIFCAGSVGKSFCEVIRKS